MAATEVPCELVYLIFIVVVVVVVFIVVLAFAIRPQCAGRFIPAGNHQWLFKASSRASLIAVSAASYARPEMASERMMAVIAAS